MSSCNSLTPHAGDKTVIIRPIKIVMFACQASEIDEETGACDEDELDDENLDGEEEEEEDFEGEEEVSASQQ